MLETKIFKWEEPNREDAPPLHIAKRGARYPTLTGVTWLSEHQYAVAHRCGLRLAVFDLRLGHRPVAMVVTPHRSDDIAAKRIGDQQWEIAVSGCFEAVYTTYDLILGDQIIFRPKKTMWATDASFSHGVKYDPFGNLCISVHTGEDPRIEIGDKVWRIPQPWGVRNVCYNPADQTYYAVAVSNNPQLTEYEDTATSIWYYNQTSEEWKFKLTIKSTHSDDCDIYQDRIWLSDQKNDRIIGLALKDESQPVVLSGVSFDFPHGLAISSTGQLAVTNYGTSSVVIFDLTAAINQYTQSRSKKS
jgi:hypothetical protein